MSDKRKHRRANLIYYLKVYDHANEQCIGHLVDISVGGLQMIGESKIPAGEDYHFKIQLPEDHPHESFSVKAKALWSKTDINPDYIASGHSFTGLSPEGKKFIKMSINRYELGNSTSSNSY